MNNKQTGFIVYDFMSRDLGISGAAVKIYALIYSFTVAGGDCHGSTEYMANRIGVSTKTVKRGLKLLMERNLIIKLPDTTRRTNTYIANLKILNSNVPLPGSDVRGNFSTSPESEVPMTEVEMSHNNKKIKNTTKTTSSTERAKEELPRFRFFGREKLVVMTCEQYDDLDERLGEKILEHYIIRLEYNIMTNNLYCKSHYKTIINWAREDAKLED